ncbi:MAG: ABC transporter permease [Propionibacteriaceae bacterium]|nr:ABC transporter permease [Propionibacteriaceae bacterium]
MSTIPLEETETMSVSADLEHTESKEDRVHRYSIGTLLGLVGLLLVVLAILSKGTAYLALSDAMDAVQLPTIKVPATPTVVICAVVCLAAAAVLFMARRGNRQVVPGAARTVMMVLAGLALVLGLLSWAVGGLFLGTTDIPVAFTLPNQFNGTMSFATPLILGALAGVVGERAGVVNVAIEGQFLTGAFAAALVGTTTGSITAGLIAGMLVGVAMGALLALFSVKYLVDQVVLGVVLNLLATGLTGYLYSQFINVDSARYNNAPRMSSLAIPGLSKIPFIGPIVFDQRLLSYLALVAIPLVWLLLYRTKWGLRVRSVGEHPEAAETVGLNVQAIKWQAVLVGGALAGLGGTYFTLCVSGSFVKGMSSGYGFIALAALIMGRWKPGLAAVMALFFGFVLQLSTSLGSMGVPINSQLLQMLPYIATIIAVAGLIGRVRAPKADGKPYVK